MHDGSHAKRSSESKRNRPPIEFSKPIVRRPLVKRSVVQMVIPGQIVRGRSAGADGMIEADAPADTRLTPEDFGNEACSCRCLSHVEHAAWILPGGKRRHRQGAGRPEVLLQCANNVLGCPCEVTKVPPRRMDHHDAALRQAELRKFSNNVVDCVGRAERAASQSPMQVDQVRVTLDSHHREQTANNGMAVERVTSEQRSPSGSRVMRPAGFIGCADLWQLATLGSQACHSEL